MPDARETFRRNLAALLKVRGYTTNTLRAVYLTGTKRGKTVAERTVRYALDDDPDSPGPSLDFIIAVADRLNVAAHLLLYPGLNPARPPVLWSEDAVREAQNVARAYTKLIEMHGEQLDVEQFEPPEVRAATRTAADSAVSGQGKKRPTKDGKRHT